VLEGSRRFENSWLPTSVGADQTDDEKLISLCPKIAKSDVFICGPSAFTRAVEKSLQLAGTPKHQIHSEEFAW
jgi:ferredoxin-NADP reductase